MDFFLQRPRSYSALCEQPGAVWRISRLSFQKMAREGEKVGGWVGGCHAREDGKL